MRFEKHVLIGVPRQDVAVLGKLGTLGHSVIIRRGETIIEQFVTAMQAALQQEVR